MLATSFRTACSSSAELFGSQAIVRVSGSFALPADAGAVVAVRAGTCAGALVAVGAGAWAGALAAVGAGAAGTGVGVVGALLHAANRTGAATAATRKNCLRFMKPSFPF